MNAGALGGNLGREALQDVGLRRRHRLHQLLEARQALACVAEHRRIVDDDDVAQAGQPLQERQHLVEVLLVLGHEQRGAAVAQLVLELGGRGRRVDAVGDRAGGLRAEVEERPLLAGVAHDRDTLAGREAERTQRERHARDERGVVAPGALAIQAEMLGAIRDRAGLGARARGEGGEDAGGARHQWRAPRKARTSRST